MSAGDRDTLAGIARTIVADYALGTDNVHESWRCGYPDTYGPCDCVDEFANHLADVLLASDWLAEVKAGAWDEGQRAGFRFYREHVPFAERDRNPHRTTENTDAD